VPYANGETPLRGDRVRDETGKLGTARNVRDSEDREFGEITVRWDGGVIGMHYASAIDFTLVSRAFAKVSVFVQNSVDS
jgi:hypothetical protein